MRHRDFTSRVRRHEVSLYVHYPFCVHKCPYCDFASISLGADRERDRVYVDALLQEFALKAPLLGERRLVSVYVGGGTPSLCDPAQLGRLLDGIAPYLEEGAEISLEANPGTVDLQKFRDFRASGFNRVSIGVQSFDDESLRRIGRIHDSKEARDACRFARLAGFDNFNIDIMHGLPRQSREAAVLDLRVALSFDAPHISWYELTIEEGTRFGKRPPVLPDEDVLEDIEMSGFEFLKSAGFEHYEVSGFNAGGKYRCVHNQNYWLYGDYLGIGAAAHQKITLCDNPGLFESPEDAVMRAASGNGGYVIERCANPEDYVEYFNVLKDLSGEGFNFRSLDAARLNSVPETGRPVRVVAEEVAFEFMLNRLRLYGDDIRSFEYALHTGLDGAVNLSRLKEAERAGLVTLSESNDVHVTKQGRMMLNDVICCFIDDAQER